MQEVLTTSRFAFLITILFFLAVNCRTDSAEELLESYLIQDSLENHIPAIQIVTPADMDSVALPIVIEYLTTNWDIDFGGKHVQYFIDQENKGLSYDPQLVVISEIDTGYRRIVLHLANENFRTLPVFDSLNLFVLPTPSDHIQLIVNGGLGSGSYRIGTSVEIMASEVAGKRFTNWEGDTTFVSDPFSSVTSLTIPEFDVTITAAFEDVPIDFALDVLPIIQSNCDACHLSVYTPILRDCEDMRSNREAVAAKITDANDPMPPTGLMPQENIDVILKWIEQGSNCNN
jgi:hypothetical protein